MKKLLGAMSTVIGVLAMQTASQAVPVEVAINARQVNSFIEFKVESDQKGEQATGHITNVGRYVRTWEMGGSNQNIWFWWDAIDGQADLTIKVDGVVVFNGTCSARRRAETSVKRACPTGFYKAVGSPRLAESRSKQETFIFFR